MTRGAPDPADLARLVQAGMLDAELAALVWLLVEARTPVVVAGEAVVVAGQGHAPAGEAGAHAVEDEAPRERVRQSLIRLLPRPGVVRTLTGPGETLAWMPEARELGWHATIGSERTEAAERVADAGGRPLRREGPPARPDQTVLVADLDPASSSPTWGKRARVVIRALSLGYGLLAVASGLRLEAVLERLAEPPVGALEDELSRLGVVLILGPGEEAAPRGEEVAPRGEAVPRVVAAHYLRPVARDAQGHVQRRPPAVLATWDAVAGRFEHFAWGILDELAGRIGTTPVALERAQARRMEQLRRPAGPGAIA